MNQQMAGQTIYPQPPDRNHRGLWVLVMVLILVLLAGAGSLLFFNKTTVLPQQSLPVSGIPTLVINGPAGNIKIHKGSSDRIIINATGHGGLSSAPDVRVSPDPASNDIAVLTGDGGSILDHNIVDLDIAVPITSNVRAIVPAGSLDINGISGQMNLQVVSGALHFQNGTIKGQSIFKNDAGEIKFDGALAPNGSYNFENNTGAINLTLPSHSSFVLDASANPGKVSNQFGSNMMGPHPNSQVHAHTNAGNVNIYKQ